MLDGDNGLHNDAADDGGAPTRNHLQQSVDSGHVWGSTAASLADPALECEDWCMECPSIPLGRKSKRVSDQAVHRHGKIHNVGSQGLWIDGMIETK